MAAPATGSSVPQTKGDALLAELGEGRNLVVLLAYGEDGSNFEDASFLPTRLIGATGPADQLSRHQEFCRQAGGGGAGSATAGAGVVCQT